MLQENVDKSSGFRTLTPEELEVVSGGDITVIGTPPAGPSPGGAGGLTALQLQEIFGMQQAAAIQLMLELTQEANQEAPPDVEHSGNEIVVTGTISDSLNDPGMQSFREFFLPFALGNGLNPLSFMFFNFGEAVLVVDPQTGLGSIFEQTSFPSPNNFAFGATVHNITIGNTSSSSTGLTGGFPLGASATFTSLNGTTVSFTIGPRPD